MIKHCNAAFVSCFMAMLLGGCGDVPSSQSAPVAAPRALAVSQPVPINQVEDAAIWCHPEDPGKGLLLVSNKSHGLEVHNLEGQLLKHYDDGIEYAGVDVLYGYPMDGGIDLAIAACPGKDAKDPGQVKLWRIDPAKGKLALASAASAPIQVLGGDEPLGICAYHSRKTNRCFFFVTCSAGKIEQYELSTGAGGTVSGRLVRSLSRPGKVKAGVTDDENGFVYFAQEKAGIWRYSAEPDGDPQGRQVIRVGENGLVPDITGLALYGASNGHGYLIAVSQGAKGSASRFVVYQREEPNAFVLTIEPSAQGLGAPVNSSGIAISNQTSTPTFPRGLLALKDRYSPYGVEGYKLYSWADIAGPAGLLIDTHWSLRPAKQK